VTSRLRRFDGAALAERNDRRGASGERVPPGDLAMVKRGLFVTQEMTGEKRVDDRSS
jgi:hypothetical protein